GEPGLAVAPQVAAAEDGEAHREPVVAVGRYLDGPVVAGQRLGPDLERILLLGDLLAELPKLPGDPGDPVCLLPPRVGDAGDLRRPLQERGNRGQGEEGVGKLAEAP